MSINNTGSHIRTHLPHLIIIGLTALLMRVFVGEVIRPIAHHDGMTRTYFNYALNLIEHGTYSRFRDTNQPKPDSLRMPLYSIYLAGVRLLSGPEQWENWVITLQYVFGALTCVLLSLLGMQLISTRVGLLAGVLAVFYVDFFYITIVLLRENLALVFLLVFLNCLVRFLKGGSISCILYAGAVYGLAVLIRPELVLLGLLLMIFLWKPLMTRFKAGKIFAVLALLFALSPWVIWSIRNFNVHGHLIPFSTDGAWGLYMGQVYAPDDAYTVADPMAMKIIEATPVEYDWYQRMQHEAIQASLHHPIRNLTWAWTKIHQTFQEFSRNGLSLMYPLMWIAIPFVAFKGCGYRKWGLLMGGAIAFVHLAIGRWDPRVPVGLLHIGFSDIVLWGAAGFSLLMLRMKDGGWKILAASFLTLIASNVIYIAHLRSRIVLCDWILLLCGAWIFFELTDYISARTKNLLTALRLK